MREIVRISVITSMVLRELVEAFPRAPELESLPSTEDQPNGFIRDGRAYYWKGRRAGKNGSFTVAIVSQDPLTKRLQIHENIHFFPTGVIAPNKFFDREFCVKIRERAMEKYIKLPSVAPRNVVRSYTRLQKNLQI